MFKLIQLILIFIISLSLLQASTIGIATGSKTIDGRPLLFKTKDRADNFPSDADTYPGTDQQFAYVFQVNHGESHLRARMGINAAGFGIVYTTSENLSGAGIGPNGAELAAMALKSCATVQDFRELLEMTANARNVHEHYGIIDSSGQGSLFEVDGFSHVEIQITDSTAAMANTAKYHPNAGPPASASTSPQREARVNELLAACPDGNLDYRYFLNEIMKDFSTTQEDEDLMPLGQYQTNAVISRYKTAAACVIKGCKFGDDPLRESIMWLSLGEPSFALALPMSPNVSETLSAIRAESENNGMAGSIDRMRQLIYDYTDGRYADHFADTNKLVQIRQHTFLLQNELSNAYDRALSQWQEMPLELGKDSMHVWILAKQDWVKTKYDSLYDEITEILSPINPGIMAKTLKLAPNYPNPFNSETVISYQLPNMSLVGLNIYNVLGQKVRTLVNRIQEAGQHNVNWDASGLPSGLYFYQLSVGRHSKIRKMMLLK